MRTPVFAGLVLAVLVAAPVAAAQPYRERFIDEHPAEALDCGSFEATFQRTFVGTQMLFFNAAGDLIKVQVAAQMTGSLSTDAVSIPLRGDVLVVIDLVRETFTFNGSVMIANQPGSGVVIQDTGRFQADFDDNVLLEAGPHDAIDQGIAAFCGALV